MGLTMMKVMAAVIQLNSALWGNARALAWGCVRGVVGVLVSVGAILFGSNAVAGPTTAATEAGSHLTVYLVTMGPGEAIYERFGHNAIWIEDRQRGTNSAFNYGIFDMGESGFILRFLEGRMWYWVEPWDALKMLEAYKGDNRSLWVQELNLTPRQRLGLYQFLSWNVKPENRFYRYDYYADNCSTRVRDALDDAVGKEISGQLKGVGTGRTYRWHTRRTSQYNPLMYTALYFVLGPGVDRAISAWEEGFLPMELQRQLRTVTVVNEKGQHVPLVAKETMVYQSTRLPLPSAPPRWMGWSWVTGMVIGGVLAGLAYWAPGRSAARWAFAVGSGLWLFVAGFAGTFSAGVWLLTTHVAAYRNENMLQFSPAALVLAVLVPAMAFGKGWARRWGVALAMVVAGGSVLGLFLKVLPWFGQVNGEMIALALPVNVAIAWAVYYLAGKKMAIQREPAEPVKRKRKT